MKVQFRQIGTAVQEGQLQQYGQSDDLASGAGDELGGGLGGTAGGQHVVDDQHPLARCERVLVDLDRLGAVLEVVGLVVGGRGQLALLAYGNEPRPEVV